MKVLFASVAKGEYLEDFDGDVLVLGINEAVGGINALIAEAKKASKRLGHPITVSAWDCPAIVSTVDIENHIKSYAKCAKILKKTDEGDFVILDIPVKQMLKLEQEGVSVECEQINVDTRNVWWDFNPKHCDIQCTTTRIPVEKFEVKHAKIA